MKPVNHNELRNALQRVPHAPLLLEEQIAIASKSFHKQKPQEQLALHSRQCVQVVELKDICYLEGNSGYTTVFLNGGNKIVTSKILKDFEELLPGTSFLRTHQSYLVNEFYIDRYYSKKGILYLNDGTEIPVSARKKEMMDHYFKTR